MKTSLCILALSSLISITASATKINCTDLNSQGSSVSIVTEDYSAENSHIYPALPNPNSLQGGTGNLFRVDVAINVNGFSKSSEGVILDATLRKTNYVQAEILTVDSKEGYVFTYIKSVNNVMNLSESATIVIDGQETTLSCTISETN